MNKFIAGKQLSRLFYEEAVRPILNNHFPQIKYSAGLLGTGSEILDLDTEMSSDHDWGPRLQIFITQENYDACQDSIRDCLARNLPFEFYGYSTNFSSPDPDDNGTQVMTRANSYPINHRVEATTIRKYIISYLGFDISEQISVIDWLTFPQQKLLGLTSGAVFYDELELQVELDRFKYYPHEVWLYLLASVWQKISQDEHLMGRAGYAGDEIGSALIANRIVTSIIRLCFLMEKKYAPYSKWLGTLFYKLNIADEIAEHLKEVLISNSWQAREIQLCQAYEIIAQKFNDLNISKPLEIYCQQFFGRPFQIIKSDRFVNAITRQIKDQSLQRLCAKSLIGSIDLFSDNTDLLECTKWRQALVKLFTE